MSGRGAAFGSRPQCDQSSLGYAVIDLAGQLFRDAESWIFRHFYRAGVCWPQVTLCRFGSKRLNSGEANR
jgi:hypothetical protein